MTAPCMWTTNIFVTKKKFIYGMTSYDTVRKKYEASG